MFPLLGILVALLLGLSYQADLPGAADPNLLGAGLAVAAYTAAAALVARTAVKRAAGDAPGEADVAFHRAAVALRGGTIAIYAAIVYTFDWPQIVLLAGIHGWILLPEALVLAPFFLLLVIQLAASWRAERAFDLHEVPFGAYLAFHFRQFLLPLIPVVVFLLINDLVLWADRHGVRWVAEMRIRYQSYPFFQHVSLAVLLFGLYCLIPFIIRWMWRAHPLPPGPVRDRLMAFAKRENFRARDVLVWPTGGAVMNAAVIGVAAPFRYVLMTDGLLSALDEDEIEAVFAHEAGHAKHHHMLLFFLFTIGFALTGFLVGNAVKEPLAGVLPDRNFLYVVLVLGGFLVWFGILFGFLSRRFEQQADVYGALATGRVHEAEGIPTDPAAHPFVRALANLAKQLGDIREATGWRHFTLKERIEFLVRFLSSPETRDRYRRRIRALLFFFFGLLAALVVAAASTIPAQLEEGRVLAAKLRADWLARHGTLDEAARAAEPAAAASPEELRAEAFRLLQIAQGDGVPPRARVSAWYQLAAVYLRMGETAWSRNTLLFLLEAGHGLPARDRVQLLAALGRVYEMEGRPGPARRAWEEALSIAPKDAPEAAEIRGGIERLTPAKRPSDR